MWLGHFFVSAHMFMCFVGAEGNWLIGLVTLSFTLAGFLFPAKSFEYRGWIYLSLALPPGLLYVVFMGMSAIFLLSGEM